ncbi:lactonase family protein [Streptomyces sp. NPDC091371]|uniref:lactonase family protein n=1 Tax=Streptomyces sp. NPDC091371 TaxID=3155303 RepID=UPI00343F938E
MGDKEADEAEHRVYIGSFTSSGGRGITTAALDPETGALTELSTTDALADPSYLVEGVHIGVVYAVSERGEGAVGAFIADGRGLRPLGAPVPVGGAGPTHLAEAWPWLLTAHYTSGGVGAVAITEDGSLAGPAQVLRHHGSGPDPERQEGPHAHQVLHDPSGRWVLSVDLGADSVRVCALDDDTGTLRPHSETALTPGNGPRHLVFHPDEEVAYVVNELRPLLTVCRWDAEAGRLEPVGEVPLVAEGGSEASSGAARAYPSAAAVALDGRFLWVAVRGADVLATLSLADGSDKPRLTGAVDCGGHWPRDLAIDLYRNRLYAANERSGDVTWFDVDPETGQPRRAGSLPVPAATCVLIQCCDRDMRGARPGTSGAGPTHA